MRRRINLIFVSALVVNLLLALTPKNSLAQDNGQGSSGQVRWISPISGCVPTGSYYENYSAYNQYEPNHTGMDWKCSDKGHPVVAPAAGRVYTPPSVVPSLKTFGNDLWILHGFDAQGNPILSYYAHLNGVVVKDGEWVTQGQTIANAGTTGPYVTSRDGAILHFGMSNKYPDDFGYFYEHASEQSSGLGWINPSNYVGNVVTLYGLDGQPMVPYRPAEIARLQQVATQDWVDKYNLDRGLMPWVFGLSALLLFLFWLGAGAPGGRIIVKTGIKVSLMFGSAVTRAVAGQARRELVDLMFDPKRRIQKGWRFGLILGTLTGIFIVWFTIVGPTLGEKITTFNIPGGPTVPVPKAWLEDKVPSWLMSWPPKFEFPEISWPGGWVAGESNSPLAESPTTTRLVLPLPVNTSASETTAAAPSSNRVFNSGRATLAMVYGGLNGWGTLSRASNAQEAVDLALQYADKVDGWNGSSPTIAVVNLNVDSISDSTIQGVIDLCSGKCFVMIDINPSIHNPSTIISRWAPAGENVWFDIDVEHNGVRISAEAMNGWAAEYFRLRESSRFTTEAYFGFYDFRSPVWVTPPDQIRWQYPQGKVVVLFDGFGSRAEKWGGTRTILNAYGAIDRDVFGIMEFENRWGSKYDNGFTPQEYFADFNPLFMIAQ